MEKDKGRKEEMSDEIEQEDREIAQYLMDQATIAQLRAELAEAKRALTGATEQFASACKKETAIRAKWPSESCARCGNWRGRRRRQRRRIPATHG